MIHRWLIRHHDFRATAASVLKGVCALTTTAYLAACGPSIEDSIDKLAAGPDERAMGKHELILAKDRAIEPIIAALESQDRAEVRPDLAEVLVSMMLRSDNPQIEAALKHHLLDDSDPRVRGRIADKLGLHLKSEFFDVFLQAVADPSPTVQTAAMLALEHVLRKLDEEQTRTLRRLSRENARAEDREVREGALFLVEEFVGAWAKKAREAALKANLSKADSLYNVALAYAPNSRQARYYLGTFYFEYGDRERALQFLRENRLLIDLPRFASAPKIDGRLDDQAWEGAVRIDSFYVHAESRTTLPPLVESYAVMGYSDEALYWGVHCFDAHPESLMVKPYGDDDSADGRQDNIMFRFDRNLDRKTIVQVSVNSAGAVRDGRNDFNKSYTRDFTWDADATAATYVGDDFWSVELEFRWEPEYHPRPAPGEISGIDIVRLFRWTQWSQPFRGYDNLYATGYMVYQ